MLQEVSHEELVLGLRAQEQAETKRVEDTPQQRVREVECDLGGDGRAECGQNRR